MPQVTLDTLLEEGSITAITKLSKDNFHIFIEKFNIRSYLDCYYSKKMDRLIGANAQRL
jgi:hypothetical protein